MISHSVDAIRATERCGAGSEVAVLFGPQARVVVVDEEGQVLDKVVHANDLTGPGRADEVRYLPAPRQAGEARHRAASRTSWARRGRSAS
jgi:hypothetical protein